MATIVNSSTYKGLQVVIERFRTGDVPFYNAVISNIRGEKEILEKGRIDLEPEESLEEAKRKAEELIDEHQWQEIENIGDKKISVKKSWNEKGKWEYNVEPGAYGLLCLSKEDAIAEARKSAKK